MRRVVLSALVLSAGTFLLIRIVLSMMEERVLKWKEKMHPHHTRTCSHNYARPEVKVSTTVL